MKNTIKIKDGSRTVHIALKRIESIEVFDNYVKEGKKASQVVIVTSTKSYVFVLTNDTVEKIIKKWVSGC